MRKILIIAAALTLPGCAAALPSIVGAVVNAATPAAPVGDKVVIEGTRALVIAHNAYQAAAIAATAAVRSGKLTPSQVERIEQLNDQALALLNGANDGLTEAERASYVLNAVSNLNAVIGK